MPGCLRTVTAASPPTVTAASPPTVTAASPPTVTAASPPTVTVSSPATVTAACRPPARTRRSGTDSASRRTRRPRAHASPVPLALPSRAGLFLPERASSIPPRNVGLVLLRHSRLGSPRYSASRKTARRRHSQRSNPLLHDSGHSHCRQSEPPIPRRLRLSRLSLRQHQQASSTAFRSPRARSHLADRPPARRSRTGGEERPGTAGAWPRYERCR
jgi:hypothetical protein